MKRQTKKQRFADFSDAMICLKKGERPHRLGGRRKDGSIPTKPVIPIENPLPEKQVLAECLEFLRSKHCLADRMNVGKFDVPGSGWRQFGILGGGDIFVIFPGGIHGEVECKAGKGSRLSVEQQRRCSRVSAHGGKYVVVHSVQELAEWYELEIER